MQTIEGTAPARPDARVRPRGARHGRPGDGGAGREVPAAACARRLHRAVGLSARFDERLAGMPSADRDPPKEGGAAIDVLLRSAGKRGDVRTTLDYDTQSAAERALGTAKRNAALVAIQPSTGDILAVANRPGDSSYDRAIEGLYPPGSTFKVVSTAALLSDGLKPSETVDCPATITVDGRQFKNFEGGAAGAVPFSRDFAHVQHGVRLARRPRRPDGPAEGREGLRPRREDRPAAERRDRERAATESGTRRARRVDDRPVEDRREPAGDGGRRRRPSPTAAGARPSSCPATRRTKASRSTTSERTRSAP